MANKIKPFATGLDASVMTDEELAVQPELSQGFIPKSKADSRLIGKLIQNATAGSYVLGEFISQHGHTDVSGSNAEQMSSSFDQAMKEYLKKNAPTPDLSNLETKVDAASKFNQLQENLSTKLDSSAASGMYETKQVVSNKINELSTAVDKKLAGKAATDHTHTIANITGLQDSLNEKATTTWASGEFAKKAPLANPTFTGTVKGTFVGNLNGDVTGSVVGNADTATKATQDASGNVITTHYATKTELNNKAAVSHKHAIADVTDLQTNLDNKVNSTTYNEDKKTFATKSEVNQKVNTTTYNQEKAGFATKSEISTFVTKSTADSTYETKKNVAAISTRVTEIDGKFANYYDKGQVDAKVASVYRYKGGVINHAALPSQNQVVGDVYNVEDTGVNVAWDGAKWDDLGGTTDLSGFLSKSEASTLYATRNEMTTGLGGKANAAHTHAEADISGLTDKLSGFASKSELGTKVEKTYVDQQLAGKANLVNPTFTGTVRGSFTGNLSGNATSATKATQDAYGNAIDTTYATKAELTSKAAELTKNIDGKAAASHTHNTAQVTGLDTALAGKAAANHTHSTAQVTGLDTALAGKANTTHTHDIPNITGLQGALDTKINLTGARGLVAGYESIGNHTTITDTSPDSNETSAAVTVNNGQAGVCWTKVVHLTAASPAVTLGPGWKWQNGTNPELKQNGFLVLCWCNTMGLAVYNNVQ